MASAVLGEGHPSLNAHGDVLSATPTGEEEIKRLVEELKSRGNAAFKVMDGILSYGGNTGVIMLAGAPALGKPDRTDDRPVILNSALCIGGATSRSQHIVLKGDRARSVECGANPHTPFDGTSLDREASIAKR